MKRFIKLIILTMLIMSLVAMTACGKNDKKEDKKAKENTQVNNQGEITAGVENNSENDDIKITQVPEEEAEEVEEVVTNYIPNFIIEGEPCGYAEYNFYNSGLLAQYPAFNNSTRTGDIGQAGHRLNLWYYTGDINNQEYVLGMKSEDILTLYKDAFFRGSSVHIDGDFDNYEFDSVENVTINGIDMVRSEGNMIVTGFKDSNKRRVLAYSFMHNGRPNAIVGCVYSYKQDPTEVSEMINNVEESVKTIMVDVDSKIEPVIASELDYVPNYILKGEPYGYAEATIAFSDVVLQAPAYESNRSEISRGHGGNKANIGYFGGEHTSDIRREDMKNDEIMDAFSGELFTGYGPLANIEGDFDCFEFDSYEFDSAENITVSGIDMIRYEGNIVLKDAEDSKRYIIAYVFMYAKSPNMIIGLIGDSKQNKKDIDEMIHNIEECIKTVHP